jgi:hypothetical protein
MFSQAVFIGKNILPPKAFIKKMEHSDTTTLGTSFF